MRPEAACTTARVVPAAGKRCNTGNWKFIGSPIVQTGRRSATCAVPKSHTETWKNTTSRRALRTAYHAPVHNMGVR